MNQQRENMFQGKKNFSGGGAGVEITKIRVNDSVQLCFTARIYCLHGKCTLDEVNLTSVQISLRSN